MFWRETILLKFLLLFATTKQYEFTALFYRITSCSKNNKLPSFYNPFAINTYSKAIKYRYNTTNIWQLFFIIIFFFPLIFFLLISCLKIYNNKFSHYFELYMHHNYYFRRKQHSYAACDAAFAASIYIKT